MYLARICACLIQPRPRGEEGNCSYLLPLSHRVPVYPAHTSNRLLHRVIRDAPRNNLNDWLYQRILINTWWTLNTPDNKVHGANMGPTYVLSAPGGPHVGSMNLAIWDSFEKSVHRTFPGDTRRNYVIIITSKRRPEPVLKNTLKNLFSLSSYQPAQHFRDTKGPAPAYLKYIPLANYSDATWASWSLKSPVTRLLVIQECIQAISKDSRISSHLCGESTGAGR